MSDFNQALPIILKHEGGYVNNPADPGGATVYGISLRFLQQNGIDIDSDGKVDANDIRATTVAKASDLYKKYFWDVGGYSRINDQTAATKVFDCSVNMGSGRAHKLAQSAANACGKTLKVDGDLGPMSVAAINACDPKQFVVQMCRVQREFYEDLIQAKPQLAVFRSGWLKRAAWPNG